MGLLDLGLFYFVTPNILEVVIKAIPCHFPICEYGVHQGSSTPSSAQQDTVGNVATSSEGECAKQSNSCWPMSIEVSLSDFSLLCGLPCWEIVFS